VFNPGAPLKRLPFWSKALQLHA